MSIFDVVRRIGASAFEASTSASPESGGVTARALGLEAGAAMPEAGLPLKDENGSGATTLAVGASGDQRIDGLLSGVRWSGAISYSDPDSAADYQAGHPEAFSNFQQINAAQLLAAHAALNDAVYTQPLGAYSYSVEGFTNLSVTYNGSGTGSGTIRLANTSNPGTAYAYYPSSGVWGGDAFFGGSGRNPTAGNYDYHTVIHELGHSLGLKHGQETGVYGALPASWDSMEFSVMTYRSYIGGPLTGYSNEQWGYAQTFMMLDIAALQHMYGADFFHNGTNTLYTWSPTTGDSFVNGNLAIDPGGNRIFQTIWDGNGIDTYDLTNYATNLTIDLNPGGHSVFSDVQRANLGGGNIARGNVFNALQSNGDARSLIENAIGGSGSDRITGNAANNLLTGNGGNDTLLGGNGNDTLEGSAGNDVIEGQGGTDTERGGGGNDRFVYNVGFGYPNSVDGGAGTDTFDFSAIGGGFSGTGISIDLVNGYSDIGGTMALANLENVWGSDSAESIAGSAGANQLLGNGGNDTMGGNGGNDTVDGGAGDDSMGGGDGNDRLLGVAGNDIAFGAAGNDTVLGGEGNDSVYGGDGNDSVAGEAGNDVLIGQGGRDTLVGGAGNDRFDFDLVSDSPVGANCDVLQAGGGAPAFAGAGGAVGDIFDLFDIDANTTIAGNQAFVFNGAGSAGRLWCVNSGTTTRVFASVDGDAAAEFQINILDAGVLAGAYSGADFIL